MPDDVPAWIQWMLNLNAKVQYRIHEYVMPHYCDLIEPAKTRANALLVSCLTPEQKEEWKATNLFTVISKSGVEYYVGYSSSLGTVRTKYGTKYCIRCRDNNLPMPDHFLAIKLMIENDEGTFLETAVVIG